ncbi:amino acid ABC transporter ATP-binding protein [Bradyrhizobium sp. cf659]|uniref:amino acid ABC transporter ATP-binding protein n=1 Tax=Bradyrhizobium sp. cf659 TaxID=1761771 RepID=UPI0008E50047|nr:amino acid ABC transporter ATP-binding protein [Bradyrhizobium sp. cf659]SFJ32456.1 polar amino acid transport system ATP-binding protein [Bradyrhizobium sp. cf659]
MRRAAVTAKHRSSTRVQPTSALDPEIVGEVLAAIQQLATNGMATICLTHEMGFAREVADEVWFMERGAVVERGKPADQINNSAHPRLQCFLRTVA